MSRYTYAGRFVNPTENWIVKAVGEKWGIFIRTPEREDDGSIPPDRRHTSAPLFDDDCDAHDYIQGMQEFFEQDYENYLEENHDAIVQMERYEDFRDEY